MLFFHSRHYDSSMSKGKRDDEEEAREKIQEKSKNNLQL